MFMTWKQVADEVAKLTPAQQNKPVLFYCPINEELGPTEASSHPDYNYHTSFVPATDLHELIGDNQDPDQYVIYPYMTEEGSLACIIRHMQKLVDEGDHRPEMQKRREQMLAEYKEAFTALKNR